MGAELNTAHGTPREDEASWATLAEELRRDALYTGHRPSTRRLLQNAATEIDRLRGALEEIERHYGNQNMNHVDFCVGAYQAAWNALNPSPEGGMTMPKGGFDHPQEALEQGWDQQDHGPPKCVFHPNELGDAGCQHIKCTYEGMDGERYRCANCGISYFLDYEEMK